MKKTIWAVIGTGPGHGIITAGPSMKQQMPLVTMEPHLVPIFKAMAQEISEKQKIETIVGKFVFEEVVAVYPEEGKI